MPKLMPKRWWFLPASSAAFPLHSSLHSLRCNIWEVKQLPWERLLLWTSFNSLYCEFRSEFFQEPETTTSLHCDNCTIHQYNCWFSPWSISSPPHKTLHLPLLLWHCGSAAAPGFLWPPSSFPLAYRPPCTRSHCVQSVQCSERPCSESHQNNPRSFSLGIISSQSIYSLMVWWFGRHKPCLSLFCLWYVVVVGLLRKFSSHLVWAPPKLTT